MNTFKFSTNSFFGRECCGKAQYIKAEFLSEKILGNLIGLLGEKEGYTLLFGENYPDNVIAFDNTQGVCHSFDNDNETAI